MITEITRVLKANRDKLAREALGLAALCVVILAGFFLPAFA